MAFVVHGNDTGSFSVHQLVRSFNEPACGFLALRAGMNAHSHTAAS